jgi:glutathione S-transferase
MISEEARDRMADLTLYDHPHSSNALKARFLLAELGLGYEKVHVPFEEPRPEWYTALNPFGRIPTLVDGDLVLPESNAILRYLANREGRFDLYPSEPTERARVDHALDAWSTIVRPPLLPLEAAALFHRDRETGGGTWEEGDPAAIQAARTPAEEALDRFERFVAANGTVLGSFTIADCAVGPVLWRTRRLPLDFERWPKASRLRDAITERPAFQAAGPVG